MNWKNSSSLLTLQDLLLGRGISFTFMTKWFYYYFFIFVSCSKLFFLLIQTKSTLTELYNRQQQTDSTVSIAVCMAGRTQEAQKALLIKQKQVKYNYTSMTSFIFPVPTNSRITKEYKTKEPEILWDISKMHQTTPILSSLT